MAELAHITRRLLLKGAAASTLTAPSVALSSPNVDPAKRVRLDAAALAASLSALYGGNWSTQICERSHFVAVSRDFDQSPRIAERDPLLEAINAYRAGLKDFCQNAPEDDEGANAYADRSYIPPMIALENWRSPAQTRDGALAALALARDVNEEGDAPMVGPMVEAAYQYFEHRL